MLKIIAIDGILRFLYFFFSQ